MSPPALFLGSFTGQFSPSIPSSPFSSSFCCYFNTDVMNSSSSNSNFVFGNSNETNTPISGFNSPPLAAASKNPGGNNAAAAAASGSGSGSNLSRPRFTKMRRNTSYNRSSTTTFAKPRESGQGFNPFRSSSVSVFGNLNSDHVPKRAYSFGAGSSNSNPSAVLEDLRKMTIDEDKSYSTNTLPTFNFKAFEIENKNKKSLDESMAMVDQLPNEINKLNIGSSGNFDNLESTKDYAFRTNIDMELQQEMHKMNLGKPESFVFGKNNKSSVVFGKKHDGEKIKTDLLSDKLGELKVSGSEGNHSKSFVFGTNSKQRDDEEVKADLVLDKMRDLKVSGVGESSVFSTVFHNKTHSDTDTFLRKNSSFDNQNVEPKVEFTFTGKSDINRSLFSSVKSAPDLKKESLKDSKYKKKKGKSRKASVGQLRSKPDFMFGQRGSFDTFEAYSPMDVSPYQETLSDNYSRATSVTSDDLSSYSQMNSVTSESNIINSNSNVTTDEDLIIATRRLKVNDEDLKCSLSREEVSESESFRSANENMEFSSQTFATAFDSDLSSTATSGCQEKKGAPLFKFGSKLENINKENFTFAASSSSQSQLSPDTRQHKKKHRSKTGQGQGQDSYISTAASSSSAEFLPISSASSTKKVDISALSNKTKDNFIASPHRNLSTSMEACEKWRLRGNQAYGNGDLAKAEDYYTQGLNSISQREKSRECLRALMLCYSNRAATRIAMGRMKDALKDCLMAAAIDPTFLKVQVRAAHCYLAIGDVENATLQYMKCLQSGSDVCVDRKLLVEASEGLEKAQKVTECIKQYTELPRTTCDELECALRVIDEAVKISSYSEQLLQMKADTLLMLRRYEQVIQMCEQSLTSADAETTSWRANIIVKSYFYLGRLEEALEFIKRQESSNHITERIESMSLESMIPLADTVRELLSCKASGNEAYKSGKYAEAVEHYSAALSCSVESRPFAAICFCNRAAAYKALGQIVDAIADCSLAIALDPNYLKAISRRASYYEMIRDYNQAAIDLRRLLSLLTSQIEEKSGVLDITSGMNELRQTQNHLYNIEEESRKDIPLNMYLILGVESTASASEVKKAYRKAALKHHPDKAALSLSRSDNGDDGLWKEIAENVHKDADRLFKMIGEAYAVLSNPSKKSKYDMDEEMRNEVNKFSQSPVFERSGSRRFQESWRPYVNTQSKGQEKTGSSSFRYARHN